MALSSGYSNLDILLKRGYIKESYGYKKVTENNTHWITMFEENKLQMYAYYSEDSEFEKIYCTNVIDNIDSLTLDILIDVLVNNNL